MSDVKPSLGSIRREDGVADVFAYKVKVTYPGEPPSVVVFQGVTYGKSVVMLTESQPGGTFVTDPERFGPELTPEWVRRFFGVSEA